MDVHKECHLVATLLLSVLLYVRQCTIRMSTNCIQLRTPGEEEPARPTPGLNGKHRYRHCAAQILWIPAGLRRVTREEVLGTVRVIEGGSLPACESGSVPVGR